MAEESPEREIDLPLTMIPQRFSWLPGDGEHTTFDTTWREIAALDLAQLLRVMRAERIKMSKRSLLRFLQSTGYTGRVVLRNGVSLVAVALIEHQPIEEYNNVRFFWVHPDYVSTKVPVRLLQLARLELPEFPTRVSVSAEATVLHSVLHAYGWQDVTEENPDGKPSRRDFRIRSIAGREHRKALEASRAIRETPPGAHD